MIRRFPSLRLLSCAALVAASLVANGAEPAVGRASIPWELYVQDNGVGRDQQWAPTRQAELLKSLGYAGIGYTGLADLDQRMAAFADHKLKIVSYYIPCETDADEPFGPQIAERIEPLHGTDAILWVHVRGQAPTSRVAETLRELGDLAAPLGLRVAVYPHHDLRIETAEEALEVVELVDRPNVGLSLNLCHELRIGNGERLDEIIDKVHERLMLVSISGADKVGGIAKSWPEVIKRLDQGDFDLTGFLARLDTVGYAGPFALQCFMIDEPPHEMLAASMAAWKRLTPPANERSD